MFSKYSKALSGDGALAESLCLKKVPIKYQQRCPLGPPNIATRYLFLPINSTLLAIKKHGFYIM